MAADFNARSIEGTLDIDIRPFATGLRKTPNRFEQPCRGKTAALADAASAAGRREMRDEAIAEPDPVTIAEPSIKRLQQAVRSQ